MCKSPCKLLACILTLTIILSGCSRLQPISDGEADVLKQLHKKYSQMKSYSATVRVTVKSNKSENIYIMEQKVLEPNQALVTVTEPDALAGLTTVFSGDKASTSAFHDEASLTVPNKQVYQDIFVNHFFAMYYRSEETAVSVNASSDKAGTILLETVSIPDDSKRYKLTMCCDVKTLEPKTITVYDAGGNIRIIAEFSNFCYNPSFSSDIFMIQ